MDVITKMLNVREFKSIREQYNIKHKNNNENNNAQKFKSQKIALICLSTYPTHILKI